MLPAEKVISVMHEGPAADARAFERKLPYLFEKGEGVEAALRRWASWLAGSALAASVGFGNRHRICEARAQTQVQLEVAVPELERLAQELPVVEELVVPQVAAVLREAAVPPVTVAKPQHQPTLLLLRRAPAT